MHICWLRENEGTYQLDDYNMPSVQHNPFQDRAMCSIVRWTIAPNMAVYWTDSCPITCSYMSTELFLLKPCIHQFIATYGRLSFLYSHLPPTKTAKSLGTPDHQTYMSLLGT